MKRPEEFTFEEKMRIVNGLNSLFVELDKTEENMECALWYIDSHSEWVLFYGYTGFHYALTDARGTLGIDIWAIMRRTTVIAMSTNATPYIQALSLMIKQNARGRLWL